MDSYKVIRSSWLWMLVIASTAVPAWALGPPAAAPTNTAQKAQDANAQVKFQRKTQLTSEEEVTAVESLLGKIDARATLIRRQLGLARQERDVVKTLCLSDKLSQLDVTSRAAQERKEALKLAVSRNDKETSDHEYVMVTVLSQRSEQLISESNQCVGEEVSITGQSVLQVTVDPTVDTSDHTVPPSTTLVGDNGLPPQVASVSY